VRLHVARARPGHRRRMDRCSVVRRRPMKELMMDRRRRLFALAGMAALLLTFAVPSFTRVVAQSSSSQVATATRVVPSQPVVVNRAGIPRTGTNILAF